MKKTDLVKVSLKSLLGERANHFYIPYYQRAYVWDCDENCQTLWDDLYSFFFPEGNYENFDADNDEYWLGQITTCPAAEAKQFEIVDGTQRIITLELMLRVLYSVLDENSPHKRDVRGCLWHVDESYNAPDNSLIKISFDETLDIDRLPLRNILREGKVIAPDKTPYAVNFRFFREKIYALKEQDSKLCDKFVARLLNNVSVNWSKTENQDDALTIFSTINDRGVPLRISDIFKAELCRDVYSKGGRAAIENFIADWNKLAASCKNVFELNNRRKGSFSYLENAFFVSAVINRPSLRFRELKKYYARDNYSRLKVPSTIQTIQKSINYFSMLTDNNQSNLFFSAEVMRKAQILIRSGCQGVWALLAKFLLRGDIGASEFNEKFSRFLTRILAFFLGSAAIRRTNRLNKSAFLLSYFDCFAEGTPLPEKEKFKLSEIQSAIHKSYTVKDSDKILRIFLHWILLKNPQQPLAFPDTAIEIEHIYAKKLGDYCDFNDLNSLDLLGNLAYLERALNGTASTLTFADKAQIYLGKKPRTNRKSSKKLPPTFNMELQALAASKSSFTEDDIIERNESILRSLVELLDQQGFLDNDIDDTEVNFQ